MKFSCGQNCILRGSWVVTPSIFQKDVEGIVQGAPSYLCSESNTTHLCLVAQDGWRNWAESCSVCQNVRNYPPSAPFILWKWATRPFRRIHIDFCQKGYDYFSVVLYSHSKWIEVQHLTVITTEKTINELPEEVISDNEPQFFSNAYEFAEFMHKNWHQTHFNSSLSPTIKWSVWKSSQKSREGVC